MSSKGKITFLRLIETESSFLITFLSVENYLDTY